MTSSEGQDLLVIEDLEVIVQNKVCLSNFNLRLQRGEIHSLFGDAAENQCALLRALSGAIPKSSGKIWFEGRNLSRLSARSAMLLGIEIIDRSRRCFLNLSVLENIFSERPVRKNLLFTDRRGMRARAEDFFATISRKLRLDDMAGSISPVDQRLVEIARSICAHPKMLLVDESLIDEIRPSLTPETMEKLYYVLSLLAKGGTTILYSSNTMDQIFKFANRISLMKNGSIQKTASVSDIDKMQLVQMTYSSLLSRRELEKSNFELFYTKQIYEGIFNSLAFPVLVTDTKRNVIVLNEAAEKMLAMRSETAFCRPIHEILGLSEETIAHVEEELRAKSKTEFYCCSDAYPRARIFFFPVLDDVESNLGMLLVFSMSNEKIDVEREIRANAERYNSEYRIAKIVHEVKNPLGIMLNQLRLIRDEGSMERIKENAVSIEKEVERVCRLLEQLKRKEDHAKRAPDGRIRISEIIRETAELLGPLIEKNKISLSIACDYDSFMPHDPDLIRQVLLNIILNGIDAMKGGGELGIRSRAITQGDKRMIAIEVSDAGTGIPRGDLERIFEPFYTTKQEDNSSGMGLAISREIVHSLEGLITVDSTLGKGSTFRVFLPATGKRTRAIRACS